MAYWFEQAAMQGDREAQSRLAKCYEQGIGVPRSIETASYWKKKSKK
ncbi:MAG: SEL1-like repeat protein [Bacilli bacterium]|nr:SEL1-like repeat protein [Bacilli bacterium]